LFALEALAIGALWRVLRVIGPDRSVRLMSALKSPPRPDDPAQAARDRLRPRAAGRRDPRSCARSVSVPTARFRVIFHEPIIPSNRAKSAREQALDMTAQVNACFEQWTRKQPEQWFEAKRRWPRNGASRAAHPCPSKARLRRAS
jgi:hypothetical protein